MRRGNNSIPRHAQHAQSIDMVDDFSAYAPENYKGRSSGGMGKGKKVALIILSAILALILGFGAVAFFFMLNLDNNLHKDKDDMLGLKEALVTPKEKEGAFYALVLGSDAREGDVSSRSDVMILCRVDPEKGTVDLISIPRDTAVNIPDYGVQKINAAHAFGGAGQAVKTVSEFAGVPISHYGEVHFNELEQLVNCVGGVEVDVPEEFTSIGGLHFNAGKQTLNGKQALAYARERKGVSGGDFSRAQAQREITAALMDKVISAPPTEMPGLISKLTESVETDMNVADIMALAAEFKNKGLTVHSSVCPSYSYSEGGVSYVGTMFDEWRELMQRVDAGLDPDDTSAVIPEKQLNDKQLGMASNSAAPRDYQGRAHADLNTDQVPQAQQKTE